MGKGSESRKVFRPGCPLESPLASSRIGDRRINTTWDVGPAQVALRAEKKGPDASGRCAVAPRRTQGRRAIVEQCLPPPRYRGRGEEHEQRHFCFWVEEELHVGVGGAARERGWGPRVVDEASEAAAGGGRDTEGGAVVAAGRQLGRVELVH
eukprot:scaffold9727_cov115-Isochrysis_galbana.AAC.1